MVRNTVRLTVLLVSFVILLTSTLLSQPMQREGKQGFGAERMRPNDGHQGKDGENPMMRDKRNKNRMPKMDPETKEKLDAIMATAEAHRQLSEIFKKQGKIDEAAAQLRSIINLADSEAVKSLSAKDEKFKNNKNRKGGFPFSQKIVPVYIQLAKLYVENKRLADAEKVINEGVAKFKDTEPQVATKLMLTLGQILKKQGEDKKAEEAFKRVIELNSNKLK